MQAQAETLLVPQPEPPSVGWVTLAVPFARPSRADAGARRVRGALSRLLVKRLQDRVLAAAALALTAPLLLVLALAVRLTSRGPVLYRQLRYGAGRTPFIIYKFRTMHAAACDAADARAVRQVVRGDPRVTPLGRILRFTSLDELPQLLNVLKGDMALVGPRPHALPHDDHFAALIDGYRGRHQVRPGMTGWAQVNGCRGEIRSLDEMRRRLALDLHYIERWSLRLDWLIMLRTLTGWPGARDAS